MWVATTSFHPVKAIVVRSYFPDLLSFRKRILGIQNTPSPRSISSTRDGSTSSLVDRMSRSGKLGGRGDPSVKEAAPLSDSPSNILSVFT